jgi:RimJ/RimL family protein N-acetyltransferase
VLAPEHCGQGLMTEAAQALIDAAFILSPAGALEASARVVNPAARRVLEKCGFAYEGTALQQAPARGGMISSVRFRLQRKTWASLKQWRMPNLTSRPGSSAPTAPLRLPG